MLRSFDYSHEFNVQRASHPSHQQPAALSYQPLAPVASLLQRPPSIDSSRYVSGLPHEQLTVGSEGVMPSYRSSPSTPDAVGPGLVFHRVVQTPDPNATQIDGDGPALLRKYPPNLRQSADLISTMLSPNTVRMLQPQPTTVTQWHGIPINSKMAPYSGSPLLITPNRLAGKSNSVKPKVILQSPHHSASIRIDQPTQYADPATANSAPSITREEPVTFKTPRRSSEPRVSEAHGVRQSALWGVNDERRIPQKRDTTVQDQEFFEGFNPEGRHRATISPPPPMSTEVQQQSVPATDLSAQRVTNSYKATIEAAIDAAAAASRYSTTVHAKREEEADVDDETESMTPPTGRVHQRLNEANRFSEWQPRQQQHWPWNGLNDSAERRSQPPLHVSPLPARGTPHGLIINATTNSRQSPDAHRVHIGDLSTEAGLRKAVLAITHEVLMSEIRTLALMREQGSTSPWSPVMAIAQGISPSEGLLNGQGALLGPQAAQGFFNEVDRSGIAGPLVKAAADAGNYGSLSPLVASTKPNPYSTEGAVGKLTTPDRRHEFLHRELGPSIDQPSLTPPSRSSTYVDQFDHATKRIIHGPNGITVGTNSLSLIPPAAPREDLAFYMSMERYLGDTHEGVRAGAAFDMATFVKISAAVWERFSKVHLALTTKLPLSTPLQAEIGNLVRQEMLRASVTYGRLVEEPFFFGSSNVVPMPYTPLELTGAVVTAKKAAAERLQVIKSLDTLPRKPPGVWMPNESYLKQPAAPVPHLPTKPINVSTIAQPPFGKMAEDLRTAGNVPYQHAAAIAIAADLSMSRAQVAIGEPSFIANSIGTGEPGVVITASVNREIDLRVEPPVWTLSLGNPASKTVISVESLQYLKRAHVSQVLKTSEQSVFVLELQPGAVRSGEQYTVWFKPTPSSTLVESRSFRMP